MQYNRSISPLTEDDIKVYMDDIEIYADQYLDTLMRREDIYDSNVFTGLIKFCAQRLMIKDYIYDDLDLFYAMWESYTREVYRYKFKPTISEFCLLIGINVDTFNAWERGETRRDDFSKKLNLSRSETCKKMQEECKLGRYKGAERGNVGCIFLMKAVDGYAETAPVQVTNDQTQSNVALQDKYKAMGAIEEKPTIDIE